MGFLTGHLEILGGSQSKKKQLLTDWYLELLGGLYFFEFVIFREGAIKKTTLYQYSRSQLEINFVYAVQCALKYTTMFHLVHLHQY